MIIGHYATALIPYSRHPKSSLLLLLVASNLNDLLWLLFAVVGLEPTTPGNILDSTFQNLQVVMTYSHDVVPTIGWAAFMAMIAYAVSRDRAVAIWCAALVVVHVACDLAAGYQHNVMGPDTPALGTGMYRTDPRLALVLEAAFGAGCVMLFAWMEKRAGRPMARRRLALLYGIFIGGAAMWIPGATIPLRELFAGGCQCHPAQSLASVGFSAALALCVWPVVDDTTQQRKQPCNRE